jgi:hypothetical protein
MGALLSKGRIDTRVQNEYEIGGWKLKVKVAGGKRALVRKLRGGDTVRVTLTGRWTQDDEADEADDMAHSKAAVAAFRSYFEGRKFLKELNENVLFRGDPEHLEVLEPENVHDLYWNAPKTAKASADAKTVTFDVVLTASQEHEAHMVFAYIVGCMFWHFNGGTVPVHDYIRGCHFSVASVQFAAADKCRR